MLLEMKTRAIVAGGAVPFTPPSCVSHKKRPRQKTVGGARKQHVYGKSVGGSFGGHAATLHAPTALSPSAPTTFSPSARLARSGFAPTAFGLHAGAGTLGFHTNAGWIGGRFIGGRRSNGQCSNSEQKAEGEGEFVDMGHVSTLGGCLFG